MSFYENDAFCHLVLNVYRKDLMVGIILKRQCAEPL